MSAAVATAFNSRRFSADPDVQNARFLGRGKSVLNDTNATYSRDCFSTELYETGRPTVSGMLCPSSGGRGKRPTPPPPPPSFLSPSSGPPSSTAAAKHDRIVRTAARAAKRRQGRLVGDFLRTALAAALSRLLVVGSVCLSPQRSSFLPAHFRRCKMAH